MKGRAGRVKSLLQGIDSDPCKLDVIVILQYSYIIYYLLSRITMSITHKHYEAQSI